MQAAGTAGSIRHAEHTIVALAAGLVIGVLLTLSVLFALGLRAVPAASSGGVPTRVGDAAWLEFRADERAAGSYEVVPMNPGDARWLEFRNGERAASGADQPAPDGSRGR